MLPVSSEPGAVKRSIGWRGPRTQHRDSEIMPEQLMTLEQVAEYLNVDRFTVYRLLSQKELPAFKVGNQWRFKRKLIEAWLMKNSNVRQKTSH
jgi:excisionase family DNA binding protein